MITPSFALTATERVLPRLALDFTTASLDPRVTFTRTGNTATVTNSSGTIVAINADLPRFDFNPTTLVCRGLLIEEARTNALVNSLIDGTDLATQLVTVTAAARTLSFYGTGTVVLSGTHSATVVGAGAYPTRTTLTFTPTAGALTLTVTGTVQYAQLEVGSFATSFIPTGLTAVTRNADLASMTGTNFSNWYNATEGTFAAEFIYTGFLTANFIYCMNTPYSTTNYLAAYISAATTMRLDVLNAGTQARFASTVATNTPINTAFAYKLDNFAGAFNGGATQTDASGTVATGDMFSIGHRNYVNVFNGWIQKLNYYSQRLTNNEVQAFSK